MPRKQPQKLKQKKPYVAPKCVELKGEDVSIWQRDQLRMAQALDRMEIDPPEMVRRIRALLEKRTKKYLGQNVTIFVKNVTQEELDIIARLRKAGILTEMPFDFKLKTANDRERGPMGFLNAGKSFAEAVITEKNNTKLKAMFMSVADIIGKMHALGIEHGHVTTGNVHLHKGRLCLTDFSMAEQKVVDWNSMQSIYNAFVRDYATRILRSKGGANMAFCKEFFRRIISYYPAPETVKQKLIKKLNRNLLNYGRYGINSYHGPC